MLKTSWAVPAPPAKIVLDEVDIFRLTEYRDNLDKTWQSLSWSQWYIQARLVAESRQITKLINSYWKAYNDLRRFQ